MNTPIDATAPFPLLPRDSNNELWLRLTPYLEARLAAHRRKNDANLPPDETAALRGRIAELKWLLASAPGAEDQD